MISRFGLRFVTQARQVGITTSIVRPARIPFGTVGTRQLSIIGDTLTKMTTNKMESDKEKRFATMMESMLSNEKWSLRPWKKTLEDQLGSWLMYVPGMRDASETKQLTSFKEILDAMTDKELDSPTLIDIAAKERISRASSKPVDEISKLLLFYKQSLIVQEWLQLKKTNGETLPQSEPELRALQDNDVRLRAIANKILGGGGSKRKTGRGRGAIF